jgi:hypothetical protein
MHIFIYISILKEFKEQMYFHDRSVSYRLSEGDDHLYRAIFNTKLCCHTPFNVYNTTFCVCMYNLR